ncbi:P-loop containing nucleoside triphosphate hydrolase protein [Ephemerocybe angulata]|uniref:dTMP kinase n=1 Tax=Ephemerocybe angulata TaxID=980116 RepID=A0A8H6I6G0_9AGAR|nr:P-loop containing nucleoside triphosphate hydrolase protein [Tulosesus angulatus]
MTTKRAPFIVVEGLDRSGKTTQTSLLQARLEKENVPNRLAQISRYTQYLKSTSELDDHVIHLLFSANRWELAYVWTVIADRYAFSGIAFSASKVEVSDATVPKLPFEWCRAPDIGLPAPDAVLFLDIAPEQARLRGGYGDERYEKEEMQARVRQAFKRIGEEAEEGSLWVVVDAGRERDVVAEEMWGSVEALVQGGLTAPVGRLWKDRIL